MMKLFKNKKGSALTMALIYMLLVTSLGTIIVMSAMIAYKSVSANEKVFDNAIDNKVQMDQVGDIFYASLLKKEDQSVIEEKIKAKMVALKKENYTIVFKCYSNRDAIISSSTYKTTVENIETAMQAQQYDQNYFILTNLVESGISKLKEVIGYSESKPEITEEDLKNYANCMRQLKNVYELQILENGKLFFDVAIQEQFTGNNIDAASLSSLSLDAAYTILNWSDTHISLGEYLSSGTTFSKDDTKFEVTDITTIQHIRNKFNNTMQLTSFIVDKYLK